MIVFNALSKNTVEIDGVTVALNNRARQVVLRLMLEPNLVVTTDQIADALWADDKLPKSARNAVARFVSDARRSLGEHGSRISSVHGGYQLHIEAGERDIDAVLPAIARVEAGAEAASVDLAEAISDLRALVHRVGVGPNPYMAELLGQEAVARSHDELRIGLIEALAAALHNQDNHVEAIALLEGVVDEHPLHERFWHLLVLALASAGRHRDAAEAGKRLNHHLGQLGVVASEPVRHTIAEITAFLAQPNTAAESVAPTVSPEPLANFAPPPRRNPLIGRIDDLRAVRGLLDEYRTVTISGLGGTGKTRLAEGLVDALADEMPVHHMNLRTVTDPQAVVTLAAAALGIPAAGVLDAHALARLVAPLQFTLLIDNCEHLRSPCVALITALHEHAPEAYVLATSRELLGLPAEVSYLLEPLPLIPSPGGPSTAAELFLNRAGDRVDVQGGGPSLELVERICQNLNGLPLAIQIAAAQLSIMSLQQLDLRTSKAFSSQGSIAEPAVTALLDVFDWAWTNLSPSQQALLARLSVFASGWTEESARAVRSGPGVIEADLDRLAALSLIQVDYTCDPVRYTMLVPVREYAAARLDERSETQIMRTRLAGWALELTAQWSFPEHHLWSGPSDVLLPEHGNLIAAMGHLENRNRINDVVTLAVGASGMMVNRGLGGDLMRWLRPHLDNEDIDPGMRGAACVALGIAMHAMGDLEGLSVLGAKSLELGNDEPHEWMTIATGYLSMWSLIAPFDRTTEELSALSFSVAEASTSRQANMALALLFRAHVKFISRDYEESLRLFGESRDLAAQPGRALVVDEIGVSLSLLMLGRLDEARASLDTWRSDVDTDEWHFISAVVRAIVMGATDDPFAATMALNETVRSLPAAGVWGRAGEIQTAYAMLADYRGEHELAAELFASADNRDIMLLSVAVAHVMETRGLTGDDAWMEVGIEFWTRIVPSDSVAATATSTPQLMRWWSSGKT